MLAVLLLLQATIPAPAWVRPPLPLGDALAESSALLAVQRHPGVLWTLNDSGNRPVLFAIDTGGRTLGRVRVSGVSNYDWEALAAGRCPPGSGTERCLYIGDIGDNGRQRPWIKIYRIAEPDPLRDTVAALIDTLFIVYPDSAHDAEAMAVDARGDLWIISKELVRAPRIYRVPAAAWASTAVATARLAGTLPIPSASGAEQWVTDAGWSADGRALMVRTYGALWRLPFVNGRPQPSRARQLCGLAGLGPQGEGLAALGGDLYALSSESLFGSGASIALVRCRE